MTIGWYKRIDFHLKVMLIAAGIILTANINYASAQSSKYDGVYAGVQTLTDKPSDLNYSQCLHGPFKRKLIVKDGTVTYTYNPTSQAQVTGTVSADGDVTASESNATGGVNLSARIQGDELTGEVWSVYCTYSLQLKRMP